jgi:transposase
MRGEIDPQMGLLTLMTPKKRVPADHPIREIKRLADTALKELDPVFDAMYAQMGRPSTPPERLLKAQLLIAFYSIRSERQFCERLDYDLLFRFFLDMNLDEATGIRRRSPRTVTGSSSTRSRRSSSRRSCARRRPRNYSRRSTSPSTER